MQAHLYRLMMKASSSFLILAAGFFVTGSFAQDVKQLQETARGYTRQGDFSNASIVLAQALQQEPKNIEISKDLAFNYYLQKDFTKALEIIRPLINRDDADDQCFQIAANIYKGLGEPKECEKLYKKGLKKFPKSGALYNEYGELLWMTHDLSAIRQWEKGIEMDAGYSGNYYNACKYYYLASDNLWSAVYGEIFLNIEVLTNRTLEVKSILLDSYKKMFADPSVFKNTKEKNNFERAFLQTLYKESAMASGGLTPESLTMIRSRFILDWYNGGLAENFPFRLFDYHLQLLKEGMFDAYNQWLFGTTQNLVAYQNWITGHAAEYNEFSKFQKGRIFKIPSSQYYHK